MPELTERRSAGVRSPADRADGIAGDRVEQLLAMQRLTVAPDATAALLDWLARRSGRWVALLGADGGVLRAAGVPDPDAERVRALAADGVALMRSQGTDSARIDRGGGTGWFVAAGAGAARPVLAAVGTGTGPAGLPRLLADAARPAGLCWRLEEAGRQRERSAVADARSREAVLHLLMIGELAPAHRIAAALGPDLPDPVRVRVVEGPVGRRSEIAAEWDRATGDRSWIVPCPVNAGHLIVISPAAAAPTEAVPADEGGYPGRADCAVGMSGSVPLRETALGYEQAFHALAAARSAPGRQVVFDRHGDLAPLLGPAGAAWARQWLRPLTEYAPVRRADPDGAELLATLTSWLHFGAGAVRHLKVHRNTLAARLHRVEDLLGLDLERLPGQAAAALALRLRAVPVAPPAAPAPGPLPASGPPARSGGRSGCRAIAGAAGPSVPPEALPAGLEALLATAAAEHWAEALLRPLTAGGRPAAAASVGAWLAHDARVAPAAAALGITAPALRKRLLRVEELLGRSLLESPSAKYDLWLAERALTLSAARSAPLPAGSDGR
ncbi:PucR family transcriptional regulator [Kitasatospora sp. NPDC057015]|uniref:PucR family transcriptional regulator n=1 Tax=Kitasatospora sp. NPDC057015 TaxID=3346001 RepID=UPI003631E128